MPLQLFNLRGVPEDEAEDIRQLLEENRIDYYETSAGNWGVSLPAFWLRDESRQFDEAKGLIDAYQLERVERAREEYRQLKAEGRLPGLLGMIKQRPLQFVVYLLLICLILFISLTPMMGW
ncbi:MAG: DUF6164 family protein [Gammaproteobacteria bacterium]|nr:DUF6164 family protein [Gammaproteobacteria bacterium]